MSVSTEFEQCCKEVAPGEWVSTSNYPPKSHFGPSIPARPQDRFWSSWVNGQSRIKTKPKGLATACSDGKAYVYHVESGGLTW